MAPCFSGGDERRGCRLGSDAKMGRLTVSSIVVENCNPALAGLRQCNSPSRYSRQTPILAKPPAGIPFLSLCTGEGKNRTAAAGGSSWRRGGSDAAPGKRGGW